jgi:hypothetical protein
MRICTCSCACIGKIPQGTLSVHARASGWRWVQLPGDRAAALAGICSRFALTKRQAWTISHRLPGWPAIRPPGPGAYASLDICLAPPSHRLRVYRTQTRQPTCRTTRLNPGVGSADGKHRQAPRGQRARQTRDTRRLATPRTVLDRYPAERQTTEAITGVGALDRRGWEGSPTPVTEAVALRAARPAPLRVSFGVSATDGPAGRAFRGENGSPAVRGW